MEKQFLISKRSVLSEVAKWAVAQSPYHRPDNLESVLDQLNVVIPAYKETHGYGKMTYKEIRNFLDAELKKIPEFLLWNERKNGNQAQHKFVDRYSTDENPDDDFIDLDALIRNVANSICREGTEVPMPKVLGESEVRKDGEISLPIVPTENVKDGLLCLFKTETETLTDKAFTDVIEGQTDYPLPENYENIKAIYMKIQ